MSRMELVGAEELIYGDDDLDDVLGAYELIGRRAAVRSPRRSPAMRSSMAQAAAMKMANAGVVVKSSEPTKARKLYLPLGTTSVAAAASANITARPQSIAFKPTRLVIPATIAPDFTIDNILVGVKPQNVQTGSAPAEAFVANAVDTELDCDTVQTSQDLVTAVTNISGATRNFRGVYFGRSADN